MNSLITVNNISKSFGINNVFNNASLEIGSSQIIALLGNNGSGKTTLLKIINGLCFIQNGEINYSFASDYQSLKENISYTPDGAYIYKSARVKQINSLLSSSFNNFNSTKFLELINEFDVKLNTKYDDLSKGNKAKVNLIIALAKTAKLKCLDEPLDGIDANSRDKFIKYIKADSESGTTYLISTHNLHKFRDIFTHTYYIHDQIISVYDEHVQEVFDDEK